MATGDPEVVNLEDPQILDVLDDEPGTSIEDIYSFLLKNEDIILTIDAEQESELRRGLALVKHRHMNKLREAGIAPNGESKQLGFRVVDRVPNTEPEQIRLQIWLKKRTSIKVHKMLVSDKEI